MLGGPCPCVHCGLIKRKPIDGMHAELQMQFVFLFPPKRKGGNATPTRRSDSDGSEGFFCSRSDGLAFRSRRKAQAQAESCWRWRRSRSAFFLPARARARAERQDGADPIPIDPSERSIDSSAGCCRGIDQGSGDHVPLPRAARNVGQLMHSKKKHKNFL